MKGTKLGQVLFLYSIRKLNKPSSLAPPKIFFFFFVVYKKSSMKELFKSHEIKENFFCLLSHTKKANNSSPIMLLRISISNTKKLFQRTLGSLKSFFSGGSYQKLPKSPDIFNNPNIPYGAKSPIIAQDMINIQWGSSDIDAKSSKPIHKRKMITTPTKGDDHKLQDGDNHDHDQVQSRNELSVSVLNSSSTTNSPAKKKKKKNETIERRHDHEAYTKNKVVIMEKKEDYCYENHEKITRNFAFVEKKLKEREMLDLSNVDHALDIEEVLHYYSRLTCPADLDIVDNFFMEIFAEFFGSNSTPVRSINSRFMRPRTSVMIKS